MKILKHWLLLILSLSLATAASAQTEEHHTATRLGNPATVFAPTIYTVADMRARFADPALQPDFIKILLQWDWSGDPADMFAAAATNDVVEWNIPVGATMPFMSSREHGKPVCLRNVIWAGLDPIHAYAFTFHSMGRIWRCVTPKPCSNFFVEDLGPEPKLSIALDCDVPDKVILDREVKVCLTVRNTGEAATPDGTVTLPIPDTATFIDATDDGAVTNNSIVWQVPSLATSNDTQQVCVRLKTSVTTNLVFDGVATAGRLAPAHSYCSTAVIGIPAILLEKADNPDPVAIGDTTTYTVKVTNQGTADDSNVQVVVTIAPELEPASSAEGKIDGQVVTLPVIPKLAPKDAVSYEIVAKGVKAGDGHTKFTLSSDMLSSPISAEESTTVY